MFLFSRLATTQIVDIEYLQELCLPIFVVEDFSGLFVHPSVLFNQRFKASIKMPGILSDLIY